MGDISSKTPDIFTEDERKDDYSISDTILEMDENEKSSERQITKGKLDDESPPILVQEHFDDFDFDQIEDAIQKLSDEKVRIEKELDSLYDVMDSKVRSVAVKNAFIHAMNGYFTKAFGHDEIRPETNETNDSWGGFGVTLIDSLSTMCVMNLHESMYMKRSIDFIKTLDFEKDVKVSFFETSIRHIGGLVSAYECTNERIFLDKVIELGTAMLPGFDSPFSFPYHELNLLTKERANARWTQKESILSEIGSIQLEWLALSRDSEMPIFRDTSMKALERIFSENEQNHSKFKGLYNNFWDIQKGTETSHEVIGIGGGGDSFYEYLLKIYLLNGDEFMLRKYEESILAIREHLLQKRGAFSFVKTIGINEREHEHLNCFFPGVLALGYMTLEDSEYSHRENDLLLAKDLMNTCIHMYEMSPTGLAGDIVNINEKDMKMTDSKYLLRPETVESLFYLYRATKDRKYKEIAWNIFTSIEKYCKTDSSYSGLSDVKTGKKNNSMQSFFLSETLKYLYLIFHSESEKIIDFEKHVFTTEGHHLKRSL